jgi:glucose-6-phosphate dehydrogenase assembly protein OpcA
MTPIDSPPLVSLQAPKDVSIDEIEAELQNIWRDSGTGADGFAATRATTFSFVVYEPEPSQYLLTALGFYSGPIDGIAGPRTTAAIKAAQKAYGLEVTGTSNAKFLEVLQQQYNIAKEQGKLDREKHLATQYAADLEGAGLADAIAASNPCRIITLCPTAGEDEGVSAQVSAYCPINKQSQGNLVCCEYITLRGTANALERIGGLISELTISELPKFLWWKASPDLDYGLFKRLATSCERLIFDSSTFNEPIVSLLTLAELIKMGTSIADLNWSRLAAWQELTAEAFDPPERRSAVWEVDRLTIDYEKGNPSQALMYLGWLASRLKWRAVAYNREIGDYDIIKVRFTTEGQRAIEAELAGLPMADSGEIVGDLISLRLTSTNPEANCGTVLCSETSGCMRMEAGGGAQSCRIQQVTSLSDQKTEQLLGRQLQRYGVDALYEESMNITDKMLRIMNNE